MGKIESAMGSRTNVHSGSVLMANGLINRFEADCGKDLITPLTIEFDSVVTTMNDLRPNGPDKRMAPNLHDVLLALDETNKTLPTLEYLRTDNTQRTKKSCYCFYGGSRCNYFQPGW